MGGKTGKDELLGNKAQRDKSLHARVLAMAAHLFLHGASVFFFFLPSASHREPPSVAAISCTSSGGDCGLC